MEMENEKTVPADIIQFAIFNGGQEITASMYKEVKNFAAHIKQREACTKNNAQIKEHVYD